MLSSRSLRALAAVLLTGAVLFTSGCGSNDPGTGASSEKTVEATPVPSMSSTPPSAPQDDAQTIEVHVTKDTVEPLGKTVDLKVGEKLILAIDAEVPGELHVHSTPEQEIAYPAGSSTAQIVINRPGIVEVESHTLDKLVLQLEVR